MEMIQPRGRYDDRMGWKGKERKTPGTKYFIDMNKVI